MAFWTNAYAPGYAPGVRAGLFPAGGELATCNRHGSSNEEAADDINIHICIYLHIITYSRRYAAGPDRPSVSGWHSGAETAMRRVCAGGVRRPRRGWRPQTPPQTPQLGGEVNARGYAPEVCAVCIYTILEANLLITGGYAPRVCAVTIYTTLLLFSK